MKAILKKTISVAAAAITAAASTCAAYAVDYEKVKINKPYINVDVTSDEAIPEDLQFSLKDSDGKLMGSWKGGVFTKSEGQEYTVLNDGYDANDLKKEELYTRDDHFGSESEDNNDEVNLQDESNPWGYSHVFNPWKGTNALNDFGEKYHFRSVIKDHCFDNNEVAASVESGEFAMYIDSSYAARKSGGVCRVISYFDGFVTESHEYSTDGISYTSGYNDAEKLEPNKITKCKVNNSSAKYSLAIGTSTDIIGRGDYFSNMSNPENYIKVKINLNEIDAKKYYAKVKITDKGCVVYDKSGKDDSEKSINLSDKDADGGFAFVSGRMINFVVPDAQGNVELYVTKEGSQSHYDGAGIIYSEAYVVPQQIVFFNNKLPAHCFCIGEANNKCKDYYIETENFPEKPLPETGWNLYDVEPGEYTVTIDSTEYELANNTFTVSDSKDIQNFNLVLTNKNASEPSETTKPDDTEEPNETTKPDNTEVPSETTGPDNTEVPSETTKPDNTEEPSETTKPDDTEKQSKTKDISSNPQTGVGVSGLAGIALLGVACIALFKKNK